MSSLRFTREEVQADIQDCVTKAAKGDNELRRELLAILFAVIPDWVEEPKPLSF